MRSASAASTRRPVSISSSARFGGMARSSGTVIMCGQSPRLISGVPKIGVVGGDDEVAGQGQAEPAGQGVALHAGDGGLAEGVEVAEEVGQLPAALVQLGEAAAVRHALEVGAGAERDRARRR